MSTPISIVTVGEALDSDSIAPRNCMSAQCVGCAENFPDDDYTYHFASRREMIAVIAQTNWHLGPDGLRCNDCAPEPREPAPVTAGDVWQGTSGWIVETSCFTIQCTRCHCVLESDCREAHFPSIRTAAEAALSGHWMVSAHRVWCRSCAALVAAGHPADIEVTGRTNRP